MLLNFIANCLTGLQRPVYGASVEHMRRPGHDSYRDILLSNRFQEEIKFSYFNLKSGNMVVSTSLGLVQSHELTGMHLFLR